MEAYVPCHEAFTRYCNALAYGKMEVEDLIQDVLLSAFEHFENIRQKDQLLPYLLRAARYRSINRWRRSKFEPELLAKQHEGLEASPSQAERALDTQLLYQALDRLPDLQKDAIILYEINGFSMKEIAEIHNSTEGAVKTKICRGRQKLRTLMEDKPKSRYLMGMLALSDTSYFAAHSGLGRQPFAEFFPYGGPQMDQRQVRALIKNFKVRNPAPLSQWSNFHLSYWLKAGLASVVLGGLVFWLAPLSLFKQNNKQGLAEDQQALTITQDRFNEQAGISDLATDVGQETLHFFAQVRENWLKPESTADALLKKVSERLNSLKRVKYQQRRELHYPSEDYQAINYWTCYYDFSLGSAPLSFRYQIDDSSFTRIYNGIEQFDLDKKAKTIDIKENPKRKDFEGRPFLYNSIITLRNIIPLLLEDKTAIKTLRDTLIGNQNFKLLTVNMGRRRFEYLGNAFELMKTDYDFFYQMTIHPDSYLPLAVLQMHGNDKSIIKTNFTDFELNPAVPLENSWFYSHYTKEFKTLRNTQVQHILRPGDPAPGWKLQRYQDGKKLSLSDLRGKVVLIDFWIKNCGPCIASVPYLNQLQDQFKDMDFEIVSINSYDSRENIKKFVNRHQVLYPILFNGKATANNYGVMGFPSLFILDKSGKVIYTHQGFDAAMVSEIEKTIKNAL